jgi:hypothetical protein
LIDINKGWVRGSPRPPLLDKSLAIEGLLGGGELPWTIANRIEQNGVGVGKARYGSKKRGDDWLRGENGDW